VRSQNPFRNRFGRASRQRRVVILKHFGALRPEAIKEGLAELARADPFFTYMVIQNEDIDKDYYAQMYGPLSDDSDSDMQFFDDSEGKA
jgi:hypothetical protein